MIAAAARRSSIRPLVQEPTNTVSTAISRSGVPGFRPMYSSARSAATRSFSSTIVAGSGTRVAQRQALAGVGAPGDERRQRVGVDVDLGVEHRAVVGAQLPPAATAASQSAPFGAAARPFR